MSLTDRDNLSSPLDLEAQRNQNNTGAEQEYTTRAQVTLELWKQADAEKEKLFGLMSQIQTKTNKIVDARQAVTDLRCCTWEQVMEEVRAIATQRESSSPKISKTMQCIDKVGRNSAAFQSWLGLLPAGDYGSSICGAFKLVIGAASQFTKVDEAAFKIISEIPEIMEDAREYVRLYAEQRDQGLEKRTIELFLSILRTLVHVMQFFADRSIRKVLEPMLKQSSYKQALMLSLEEVKKSVDRNKDEAARCLARRVADQGYRISETYNNSEQSLTLLRSIFERLQVVHSPQSSIQTTTHQSDRRELSVVVDGGQPVPTNGLRAAHCLLEMLQYDPDMAPRDNAACLQSAQSIDESGKARAAALLYNPKFRAKMLGDASTSILVNGHEDLSTAEGTSPLSLITARFAVLAETSNSVFVVRYFIDQHRPKLDNSPFQSSVGMMASLVCQLLSQMIKRNIPVNLAFLAPFDWERAGKLNLNITCNIFHHLTYQLPPKSVLVCLIDEITLYETAALAKDTDAVIRRLTRLVRES